MFFAVGGWDLKPKSCVSQCSRIEKLSIVELTRCVPSEAGYYTEYLDQFNEQLRCVGVVAPSHTFQSFQQTDLILLILLLLLLPLLIAIAAASALVLASAPSLFSGQALRPKQRRFCRRRRLPEVGLRRLTPQQTSV
ncbi:hypothetical protein B296_00042681 [Ensete ventricosum]|uniref:Uncharacterized protein n=1 Tax=Ensete ventricosum TaxID=4639 RepID=A0A426X214_ENSVE|nr:hypothetical protein B296_00042681 [Ensete ventricosum]